MSLRCMTCTYQCDFLRSNGYLPVLEVQKMNVTIKVKVCFGSSKKVPRVIARLKLEKLMLVSQVF